LSIASQAIFGRGDGLDGPQLARDMLRTGLAVVTKLT
jgi:hypothetical protein